MTSMPQSDPAITGQQIANNIISKASEIILGKEHALRLALACLLARGHLLIEDIPGVGKTTLAHLLARILGLDFTRIQFTSDLLPADILGVSVFEQSERVFHFHPGPIFSHVVLADEINRATPKTQSALLEAMEERQVTVDGETRTLADPFFVIATQNPLEQIGTFALPESQLDRFLMRITLGYPDATAERNLLMGRDRRDMLQVIEQQIDTNTLISMQKNVQQAHCSDALIDYIQAIISASRSSNTIVTGLSPRAGLALLQCAKAWAFMHGRDHVLPEDVQQVLPGVVMHRLRTRTKEDAEQTVTSLLNIPIP